MDAVRINQCQRCVRGEITQNLRRHCLKRSSIICFSFDGDFLGGFWGDFLKVGFEGLCNTWTLRRLHLLILVWFSNIYSMFLEIT